MTLERSPEVQQVISALCQIATEPERFNASFTKQALVAAVSLIRVAYRAEPTRAPITQSPGQLDIYEELRAS